MKLLFLTYFALIAHAEDTPVCAPIAKLAVRSCPENRLFERAARVCDEKLGKEIALAQATLAAASAAAAASTDGQEAGLAGQAKNLADLRLTLAQLLEEAEKARRELVRYSASFSLPGPVTLETAKKLGLEDFFGDFPCYAENARGLAGSLESVSHKIDDLKGAVATAATLSERSQAALERYGVGKDPAAPTAKATYGDGGGSKMPAGRESAPASDITGTDRPAEPKP